MVAHTGGLGIATVQGAYSARSGSQVISALIPRSFNPATKRSVNTSVPVPVRTVGNQMAGWVLFMYLSLNVSFLKHYRLSHPNTQAPPIRLKSFHDTPPDQLNKILMVTRGVSFIQRTVVLQPLLDFDYCCWQPGL